MSEPISRRRGAIMALLFPVALTVVAFVIGKPDMIFAAGVLFGLGLSDAADAWYSK